MKLGREEFNDMVYEIAAIVLEYTDEDPEYSTAKKALGGVVGAHMQTPNYTIHITPRKEGES